MPPQDFRLLIFAWTVRGRRTICCAKPGRRLEALRSLSSSKFAIRETRVAGVDGHRREALVGEPPGKSANWGLAGLDPSHRSITLGTTVIGLGSVDRPPGRPPGQEGVFALKTVESVDLPVYIGRCLQSHPQPNIACYTVTNYTVTNYTGNQYSRHPLLELPL